MSEEKSEKGEAEKPKSVNPDGSPNPEYGRWYRAKNREKIRERNREYYHKCRKENPEKIREARRRRRRTEEGKAEIRRYNRSEKAKAARKRYQEKARRKMGPAAAESYADYVIGKMEIARKKKRDSPLPETFRCGLCNRIQWLSKGAIIKHADEHRKAGDPIPNFSVKTMTVQETFTTFQKHCAALRVDRDSKNEQTNTKTEG